MSTTKVTDAMIDGVAASKLTGALPAISGASLTNLDARDLENALPAISGASLTSLDAGNLGSGTTSVARGGTGAATHTANNVLVGNGTSAIASVAPSTSGNVLTSNGSAWTSAGAAGGGAWTYISSATASGSSSIDFIDLDTSTYKQFMVHFYDWQVSATAYPSIVIREAGSSTWITTTTYHGRTVGGNVTTTDDTVLARRSSSAVRFQLTHYPHKASTTQHIYGNAYFSDLGTISARPGIFGTVVYHSNTGDNTAKDTFGGVNATEDSDGYDGIRFEQNTGTITTGTFDLYGLIKS